MRISGRRGGRERLREAARGKGKGSAGVNIQVFTRVKVVREKENRHFKFI